MSSLTFLVQVPRFGVPKSDRLSGHISRHFEQLSELEVVRDLYTDFEAV